MVRKRLTDKITDTSKALANVKPGASGINVRRKTQDTIESAKSASTKAMVSGDGLRRKAQGAIKTTGTSLVEGRGRAAEITAVAKALNSVIDNVSYADLGSKLQTKFKAAGLGGDRGARTVAESQSFFDSSVPDAVKMLGEDAVNEFLADKHASHIRSFENAPELVKADSNLLWENGSANLARGSENMTGFEQLQVNLSNGFDAFRISATEIVPQAMFYAAAIEGGISIVENSIYVYRGQKDIQTALQDTARNTAKSAVVGLVAGTAIAGASTLGASPVIATVAPVLGVVGGALLVYSASKRIHTALTVPVYDEQSKVIDSYVVRYIDDDVLSISDDDLLTPLNNQLVMLNILKAEILRAIPKEGLKQLPAPKEEQFL